MDPAGRGRPRIWWECAATAVVFAALSVAFRDVWDLMSRPVDGMCLWRGGEPSACTWAAGIAHHPSRTLVGGALVADVAFIALFALMLVRWADWRAARVRVAAGALIAAYVLADLGENHLAWSTLASTGPAEFGKAEADRLHLYTAVKLVFAVLALLAVYASRQQWLWRPEPSPVPAPDAGPADAPWSPDDSTLAISLSGGGIRSAAFSLGVIQQLRAAGILGKARWLTAVSGGSYLASALTILNQDALADPLPEHVHAHLDPGSPDERYLRSHLRYLVTGFVSVLSSLSRIVSGLLFNLILLYLVMFAVLRPVGWLIGSPALQPQLRVDRDIGWTVLDSTDDPDYRSVTGVAKPGDARRTAQPPSVCGIAGDTRATKVGRITRLGNPPSPAASEPVTERFAVAVVSPPQCVEVSRGPGHRRRVVQVSLAQSVHAVVALSDGKLTVERQPTFRLAAPRRCVPDGTTVACTEDEHYTVDGVSELFHVSSASLAPTSKATGLTAGELTRRPATWLKVDTATYLRAEPPIRLRGDLDIDVWHWAPGAVALLFALAILFARMTIRPDRFRILNIVSMSATSFGLLWLAVCVALPWLVANQPKSLMSLGAVGPDVSALPSKVLGLPVPSNLSPLLAWLFLSVSAVWRYFSKRPKAADASTRSGAPNKRALLAKVTGIIRRTLVAVVLVAVALFNAVNIMVVGAMNGPAGRHAWLSLLWLGNGARSVWPADIALWTAVIAVLVLLWRGPESMSWSAGPVYKRALARAFAMCRTGEHVVGRRYQTGDTWSDLAARLSNRKPGSIVGPVTDRIKATEDNTSERAGFADGKLGDGTELVLCAAANILGEGDAPTARRAVSFTASRSHVGGPEVGWLRTPEYTAKLGRRRSWDMNVMAMTAISGAAVSPAMGKSTLGPIGSLLSMLNVRLGVWLPNPEWVRAQPANTVWEHQPGWTWFAREVIRRFRRDAQYIYVTDGGHWENLGLVEALRRGAKTVVMVSAAGDGELSNSTLAEAIEIARTDLHIEVNLDDAWNTRPRIGGDVPKEMPSKRQYILEPSTNPTLGRAAPRGYAFGTMRFPGEAEPSGRILLIEAAMVDNLPVDVHAYSEAHPEFPNVSTGDQFFTDRDFESYRVLGATIVGQALGSDDGSAFLARAEHCHRRGPGAVDVGVSRRIPVVRA